MLVDRALIDIRQHRVRPTEGQQRGLGEEPAHLRERVLPAVECDEHAHRRSPQHEADHGDAGEAAPVVQRVGRRRRVVVDDGRTVAV